MVRVLWTRPPAAAAGRVPSTDLQVPACVAPPWRLRERPKPAGASVWGAKRPFPFPLPLMEGMGEAVVAALLP